MEFEKVQKVSRSRQETRIIWTAILENCRQLYKSNVSKKIIRSFYRKQICEYHVGKNAFRFVEKYLTKPTRIIYSDAMNFLKESKSKYNKDKNEVRDLFPETIGKQKYDIRKRADNISSSEKKIKIEGMFSIMDANDISIIDIFRYYEHLRHGNDKW